MIQPDQSNFAEVTRIATAKKIVMGWIADARADAETVVSTDEMRTLYLGLNSGQHISAHKFSSMLAKNGVQVSRIRLSRESRITGMRVKWTLVEFEEEGLIPEETQPTTGLDAVH